MVSAYGAAKWIPCAKTGWITVNGTPLSERYAECAVVA
jgi:hypothetical protein